MNPVTHGPEGRSGVGRSGRGTTPWLSLAGKCAVAAGAAGAILALAGLIASGPAAAGSVLFAAVIVIAFFALSLIAGHFAGRNNPSGAIGVFAVVYVLKIVGFAALLLWLGKPAWIVGPWFGASGIVTVVVWQAVEVFAFSRLRLLIFEDSRADEEGPHA